mgnify:FL=1
MKLVMKFGGTSVADGERIRGVAKIVADYAKKGNKMVVVVSALNKTTDQLIEASERARVGDEFFIHKFVHDISERHIATIKKAIENEFIQKNTVHMIQASIAELEKALSGITYLGDLSSKSMDYVLSFGERLSTPIVWGALTDMGLHAQHYTGKEVGIVTDSNFGDAKPLMNLTKHQVKDCLLYTSDAADE